MCSVSSRSGRLRTSHSTLPSRVGDARVVLHGHGLRRPQPVEQRVGSQRHEVGVPARRRDDEAPREPRKRQDHGGQHRRGRVVEVEEVHDRPRDVAAHHHHRKVEPARGVPDQLHLSLLRGLAVQELEVAPVHEAADLLPGGPRDSGAVGGVDAARVAARALGRARRGSLLHRCRPDRYPPECRVPGADDLLREREVAELERGDRAVDLERLGAAHRAEERHRHEGRVVVGPRRVLRRDLDGQLRLAADPDQVGGAARQPAVVTDT